jgi:glycosyltransferase involved in cell wall biosynthesis
LELSPKKIADQVKRLLIDPYLMETLKDNAKKYAKNYDWNLIVAELERVYKDVIS